MPNEVVIHIKGKDEASAAIGDVEKKAKGLGSALGDTAKIAGGFMAAQGIEKVGGFLMDAANAAAEDEAAQLRLKNAIENTGAAYDVYGPKVEGVVTAAQNMGFADDDSRASLSLLMAQTGDADEAMRRFALAQDVARGAGIPLEQASKLLGKVTEENVNVFKKMGITMAEGATEADVYAALQGKFAGQADTFANSTAGQMMKAKIQMGELKEKIGYAVLPIMAKLSDLVATKLVPAMMKLVDAVLPPLKAGFDALNSAVKPVWEAVKPFVEGLAKNQDVLKIAAITIGVMLVPAFAALAIAAGTAAVGVIATVAPFVAVGVAIAAVVAAIYLLITHWNDVTAAVGNFLEMIKGIPVLGEIVSALQTLIQAKIESIIALFQGIIQIGKDIITFFKDVFSGDWSAAWEDIKKLGTDALKALVTYVTTIFNIDIIKALLGFIPWDGMKKGMGDLWTNFTGMLTSIKDWAIGHWPEIATILSGPFAPLVALATDGFGVRTALQDAMTAVKIFVGARVDDIVGFFTGLPGRVTATLGSLLTAATSIGTTIKDGIIAGIQAVGGLAGDIANSIKRALVDMINGVIQQLNDAIPDSIGWGPVSFDISPNPIPPIALAKGGIVTKPTLALLGEHGDEAVIPLGRGVGMGGGTTEIHMHVQGSILSERDIERVIADALRHGKFRGLVTA